MSDGMPIAHRRVGKRDRATQTTGLARHDLTIYGDESVTRQSCYGTRGRPLQRDQEREHPDSGGFQGTEPIHNVIDSERISDPWQRSLLLRRVRLQFP